MKTFKFKELEITHEDSWLIRTMRSPHFRKTVLYGVVGAVIGYVLYYLSLGTDSRVLWSDEAMSNVLMGLAFGVFITNSPCARGKC